MKPKHHIYISFGAKGAKVDVGCVTLYYGEGQENEMIRDFERYLSEPEEMEKPFKKIAQRYLRTDQKWLEQDPAVQNQNNKNN